MDQAEQVVVAGARWSGRPSGRVMLAKSACRRARGARCRGRACRRCPAYPPAILRPRARMVLMPCWRGWRRSAAPSRSCPCRSCRRSAWRALQEFRRESGRRGRELPFRAFSARSCLRVNSAHSQEVCNEIRFAQGPEQPHPRLRISLYERGREGDAIDLRRHADHDRDRRSCT